MVVPLPHIDVPRARGILNQVKLGKGPALKQLRDVLAANPRVVATYVRERKVAEENERQRKAMMWVRDATSRVRRVDTPFRERCTYTNPMSNREIPERKVVERCKAREKFNALPPPSEFRIG